MICPNCSELIPDISKFCLHCGSQIFAKPLSSVTECTIQIRRLRIYSGSLSPYKIIIDDQNPFFLQNGQTMVISVSPGKHTVFAKYGIKSTSFELSFVPSETVKLICGVAQGFWRTELFFAREMEIKSN